MAKHRNHTENRATVLRMKAEISSITGKPHSYAEIGAALGMSSQAAFLYAGDTTGLCPSCLRALNPSKPQTKNKKTK